MNQNKVVELCERMTKLMADPQPGFATWNIMCQDVVEALTKELAPPAPPGPTDLEIARASADAMGMAWVRQHAGEVSDGLERIRQTKIDPYSPALVSLRAVLRMDALVGAREK